jgi:hypothetical protein
MCCRVLDPDTRHRAVPAGGVRGRVGGLSVNWSGDGGLMNVVAYRLGKAIDGKETQRCKCQKGRDGGVHTHHDFGGAERQSIFYTTAPVGKTVSDQVDSVYLSINSGLVVEPSDSGHYFCWLAQVWRLAGVRRWSCIRASRSARVRTAEKGWSMRAGVCWLGSLTM